MPRERERKRVREKTCEVLESIYEISKPWKDLATWLRTMAASKFPPMLFCSSSAKWVQMIQSDSVELMLGWASPSFVSVQT